MSKIKFGSLSVEEWRKLKKIRLEAVKTNPKAFLNTYEEVLKYSDEKWQRYLENSVNKNGAFYLFAFEKERNKIKIKRKHLTLCFHRRRRCYHHREWYQNSPGS